MINMTKVCMAALETDFPAVPAGPALVYLYRRFGPSDAPSDAVKSVVDYDLPTTRPGVYLCISVGAVQAWISCTLSREAMDAVMNNDTWRGGDGSEIPAVEAALAATLRDLLRPVRVQSSYINLLGPTADPGEWDNAEEQCAIIAPRFRHAGLGFRDIAGRSERNATGEVEL